MKVWYVRRSLEEAISKLADNIEKQTSVLQSLAETTRTTKGAVERIEAK